MLYLVIRKRNKSMINLVTRHLMVVQELVDFHQYGADHVTFDVILHLGTLTAVVIAFWSDVKSLVVEFFKMVFDGFKLRNDPGRKLVVMLLIATCPLAIGALIDGYIEAAFSSTLYGTAREIKDYTADYARRHGLLDATFFHGFSSADTAQTCACVVAVADGRAPEEEAEEMARHIWGLRHGFVQPALSAGEAVDRALELVRQGYVVINETSDNPGGGCPGDGTHLLAELIRRDLAGSIFGVIYDPAAAQACHQAGVGARVRLSVGGHSEALFGPPLELEAEVLGLSDGAFVCASSMYPGLPLSYGPTARVRCGQVEMVLVSRQMQSYDDRPLLMTGARMEDYRIVALKSSNHFRAYFKDTADAIVTADTPGLFPADVKKLDYQKVRRPIFPLDDEAIYPEEV